MMNKYIFIIMMSPAWCKVS